MRITILLLVAYACSVMGQTTYHKMLSNTNEWYVSAVLMAVKSPDQLITWQPPCIGHYLANTDSVYNGKTYKRFQLSRPSSAMCYNYQDTVSLIREDTIARKVYIIPVDSTTEYLAYDFSMNVGDSIYLPFYTSGTNATPPLPGGYYRLDSIQSRVEKIGPRNHYYLTNHLSPVNGFTGKRYYLEWIESIGAVHFPLNLTVSGQLFSMNFLMGYSCPSLQYSTYVTCKFSDNVHYYFNNCAYNFYLTHPGSSSSVSDSCNYFSVIGGVHEYNDGTVDLRLYPNPATDVISMESVNGVKPDENCTISVWNASGQLVMQQQLSIHKGVSLQVAGYRPGLYYLRALNAQGQVLYKGHFVKE